MQIISPEPMPDPHLPLGSELLEELGDDTIPQPAHRLHAAPSIAVKVIETQRLTRAAPRSPGAYNWASQRMLQGLYAQQVTALYKEDERITYIDVNQFADDRRAARRHRTIRELDDDGSDAFEQIAVSALAVTLRELMQARNFSAVELVPAVGAQNPIDLPLGWLGSHQLRRRIPSVRDLLHMKRMTAQSAGITAYIDQTSLERSGAGHLLPRATTESLRNQVRWARQDLAAHRPRLLTRLLAILLVYGPYHDAVEQAYIVPHAL